MDLRTFYSPKLKLAITGGTGFIGSALIRTLLGTSESDNKFSPISLADVPSNTRLVHCAATISNGRDCLINNASIDSFVFDACVAKNLSVVYCSTNNVYPLALNCTTSVRANGSDYYSLSKISGEYLFRSRSNLNSVIIRIGDVFGFGQRHGNLFKAIASSLSTNQPLRLFGKGLKVRSFIHIEELVSLICFVSEELISGRKIETVINGSVHDAASVRDIVEYIGKKTNLEIISIPQADDTSDQDVRSMVTFSHSNYQPKFISFWDSLDHYINSCLTTREHNT
jgi:nucleoside-diphosphate-sugar epimerase